MASAEKTEEKGKLRTEPNSIVQGEIYLSLLHRLFPNGLSEQEILQGLNDLVYEHFCVKVTDTKKSLFSPNIGLYPRDLVKLVIRRYEKSIGKETC